MPNLPSHDLPLEELLAFIEAEVGGSELPQIVLRLKKQFPGTNAESLTLAAEIFVSRKAAVEKLGSWAKGGYFSKSVLEQSSRSAIAALRASRFCRANHVIEIGTGSGSDTAASNSPARAIRIAVCPAATTWFSLTSTSVTWASISG